jgi:hypothetical protein
MPHHLARLSLAAVLLVLAPSPPIYPGAKRDTPQALIQKSTGVEASATYVTPDAFEKVDSFYRTHGGAEDTGARRVSASSKRALFYFADSKSDVLVLWPKDGSSDQTSIVISKE